MGIVAFPSDRFRRRRGQRMVVAEDALTQMAEWIVEQSRRITELEERVVKLEGEEGKTDVKPLAITERSA